MCEKRSFGVITACTACKVVVGVPPVVPGAGLDHGRLALAVMLGVCPSSFSVAFLARARSCRLRAG